MYRLQTNYIISKNIISYELINKILILLITTLRWNTRLRASNLQQRRLQRHLARIIRSIRNNKRAIRGRVLAYLSLVYYSPVYRVRRLYSPDGIPA